MNIHRCAVAAMAGTALVLSLAACSDHSDAGGTSTTSEQESDITKGVEADPAAEKLVPADVKDAGSITVAMDLSYPPTSFLSEGDKQPIGYNVDIANLIATKLGLDVNIKDVSFETIIPGIQGGRYDFTTTNMTPTPERLKVLDMITYWEAGSSLVTTKDNPEDFTFEDPSTLCGHKVAVMTGTTQAEIYLPEISKECKAAGEDEVDATTLPNVQDALTQLASGRLEAVFYDTSSLAWAAKQQPDQFDLLEPQYQKKVGNDIVAIGLDNDSALTEAIHAAVESMMADGTYQEALDRWGLGAGAIDTSKVLK